MWSHSGVKWLVLGEAKNEIFFVNISKASFHMRLLKISIREFSKVRWSACIASTRMAVCSHCLSIKDVSQMNLKRKIRTEYSRYFKPNSAIFPIFFSGVTFLFLLSGFDWFIRLLKTNEPKIYMDFPFVNEQYKGEDMTETNISILQ